MLGKQTYPEQFPKADYVEPVYPAKTGYLSACRNSEVGMSSLVLGGGRETKESQIDLTVGIRLLKHLGDKVDDKEPFAYLYGNDKGKIESARMRLLNAYSIQDEPVETQPVIKKIILEA